MICAGWESTQAITKLSTTMVETCQSQKLFKQCKKNANRRLGSLQSLVQYQRNYTCNNTYFYFYFISFVLYCVMMFSCLVLLYLAHDVIIILTSILFLSYRYVSCFLVPVLLYLAVAVF